MEKKEIFARVTRIEEQIGSFYEELSGLKEDIVQLIEENTRLLMENQSLREQLKGKQNSDPPSTEPLDEIPGEGHDNLARLYNEGFHICNVHYGNMREEGDCLFCLAFLNK